MLVIPAHAVLNYSNNAITDNVSTNLDSNAVLRSIPKLLNSEGCFNYFGTFHLLTILIKLRKFR